MAFNLSKSADSQILADLLERELKDVYGRFDAPGGAGFLIGEFTEGVASALDSITSNKEPPSTPKEALQMAKDTAEQSEKLGLLGEAAGALAAEIMQRRHNKLLATAIANAVVEYLNRYVKTVPFITDPVPGPVVHPHPIKPIGLRAP